MSVRNEIRSRFRVSREFGDELIIACPDPDHEDANPSASINVRKGVWNCYSCGASGRLETLLGRSIASVEVDDVVAELRQSLAPENQITRPESWLSQFDVGGVHPYWLGRGLSERVCREFRLGYDFTTGRATIPLRTPSGDVMGVIRRSINGEKPKYKYDKHAPVSTTLFGYHKVRMGGMKDIVVVEGALDAVAMWDVGIPAVAQLGSRLSGEQKTLLLQLGTFSITFAYDQDAAGRKALDRSWDMLRSNRMLMAMMWDPLEGKDVLELPRNSRVHHYECSEPML